MRTFTVLSLGLGSVAITCDHITVLEIVNEEAISEGGGTIGLLLEMGPGKDITTDRLVHGTLLGSLHCSCELWSADQREWDIMHKEEHIPCIVGGVKSLLPLHGRHHGPLQGHLTIVSPADVHYV